MRCSPNLSNRRTLQLRLWVSFYYRDFLIDRAPRNPRALPRARSAKSSTQLFAFPGASASRKSEGWSRGFIPKTSDKGPEHVEIHLEAEHEDTLDHTAITGLGAGPDTGPAILNSDSPATPCDIAAPPHVTRTVSLATMPIPQPLVGRK